MWVTGGTRHGFHRLVLLALAEGRHWEGKKREPGNFRKSCKKFRRVTLTAEPQEITESMQQFSIRALCDVCKGIRGSVCECVEVCVCLCVCARARAEERAFACPGHKVT